MTLGTPGAEIALVIAAYFVGGIPFGWLVALATKRVDLRRVGSGGTGATNCSRLWTGPASVVMFVLVFCLDFAKGLFAALFSANAATYIGDSLGASTPGLSLQVMCGLAAVLGHVFTPFLRFRGGEGVATTFGVVTALAPISSLYGLGAWGVLVSVTRYMSLGSLAAMFVIPLSYWLDYGSEVFRSRLGVLIFFLCLAGVVFWRHRGNIQRILAGSERRVGELDQKL